MATIIAPSSFAASTSRVSWQEKLWKGFRLAAIAGFLCLAVVVPLQGHHKVSYSNLVQHLQAGDVHDVTVYDQIPHGATGFAHPTIVWKSGWVTHESTVLQVSDSGQSSSPNASGPERVVGDLASELRAQSPAVHVHERQGDAPNSGGEILGWTVPTWAAVLMPTLLLLTLGLIQGGPEPRYATRWAWIWFTLSPLLPLAAMSYLVFAPGSDPDEEARRSSRHISGGWAFLIVLFCLGGFGASRG